MGLKAQPAVGATLIGADLCRNGVADSSPPPCGEGSGVGVGKYGTSVPHGTTPPAGRESRRLKLAPMWVGHYLTASE